MPILAAIGSGLSGIFFILAAVDRILDITDWKYPDYKDFIAPTLTLLFGLACLGNACYYPWW